MRNSKTLRHLKNSTCIKCGNVIARSMCPYQSCKSCCVKAQNSCHIHVLEGGTNIPEVLPSAIFPKVDQPSTEVTHSVGKSIRNKGDRDSKKRQYRCSMQGILQTYNNIRDHLTSRHLALIGKTPFHMIFKAIHDEPKLNVAKREVALDSIIRRYSKEKDGFNFGKGQYHMFEQSDIKLIFGLTDGNHDIKFPTRMKFSSQFTTRLFPGKDVISVPMLKSKIMEISKKRDKVSIEDTVRALCLLLIGSFLLVNTGTKIATGYYKFLDFFNKMSDYNWSKVIADTLRQSLREREGNDPKTVAGCTIFLLYWFCEHYEKMSSANKQIPRFRRWKLSDVSSKVAIIDFKEMRRTEFKHGPLKPTEVESRKIGVVIPVVTEFPTQSKLGKRKEDKDKDKEVEVEDSDGWRTEEDYSDVWGPEEEAAARMVEEQHETEKWNNEVLQKLQERNLKLEEENLCLNNQLKEFRRKALTRTSGTQWNKEEEEKEEMQREIYKLHAQIKELQNQVDIAERNRFAIIKSPDRIPEENQKMTGLEEVRMAHIVKQLKHIERSEAEVDAQKERIECMNEQIKNYTERVKRLEADNFKLNDLSSNQRVMIEDLTEKLEVQNIQIQAKDKEIEYKKTRISNLQIAKKELEIMVKFPDFGSSNIQPPKEVVEEEHLQTPNRKRIQSEVINKEGIQNKKLKVLKMEENIDGEDESD